MSNDNASTSTSAVDMEQRGGRARRAAEEAAQLALEGFRIAADLVSLEPSSVPRIARSDLALGDLLGRGGFCDVREVVSATGGIVGGEEERGGGEDRSRLLSPRARRARDGRSLSVSLRDVARRCVLAARYCRDSLGMGGDDEDNGGDRFRPPRRYAVKHLSASALLDEVLFKIGAVDLAIEAAYLSGLSHPNLIRLHGVSEGGCAGFETGREDGFFLVLDRLYGTLEDRIVHWSMEERRYGKFVQRKFLDKSGDKRRALFVERLKVAYHVASVLAYLHDKRIMHRDIKPDNIGFDEQGNVKLFDLGLAKALKETAALEGGVYKLTGKTGSLAYMAPEVARSQPYNLSADVYSFSVLLWEVCSLQQPYHGMGPQDHRKLVVHGTVRPEMNALWSDPLKWVMQSGWDPDTRVRPEMDNVCDLLRVEIFRMGVFDETEPRRGRNTEQEASFSHPSQAVKPHRVTRSASAA